MSKKVVILAVILFLVSLVTAVSAQNNQDDNQAALVISLADGEVISRCVSFPEAEISGWDLLQRADLAVAVDASGLGTAVCQIEDTGCPANNCFCQCRGGDDCEYWSFWLQQDGQWRYSQAGAALVTVRHGDVQGWSWGPGSPNEAPEPPPLTFADVCRPAAPESDSEGLMVGDEGFETTAVPATPTVVSETPAETEAPTETAVSWVWYGVVGVVVIVLAGILLNQRQRGGA